MIVTRIASESAAPVAPLRAFQLATITTLYDFPTVSYTNMGFLDIVIVTSIITASMAFTLLITVPLLGTLIRYRANYNPKGLQLDAEGGAQPHTGPVVTSYFTMMRRVKRLEGWSGLYKGIMPTFLSTVAIMVFAVLVLGVSMTDSRGHSKYSAPTTGIIGLVIYSLFMMIITLPVVIITNRTVTTPHKLPWFNAIYSLRVLLTPTERRRPWTLFLTPGLLFAESISLVYIVLILQPIRRLIFPNYPGTTEGSTITDDFTWTRVIVWLAVVTVSTAILCPLEVISTRLSIQRNHTETVPEDNTAPTETAEYSAPDEDVIGLRDENDPYVGFVDCSKRIIQEEGVMTLYRAWWLVAVGIFFGAL